MSTSATGSTFEESQDTTAGAAEAPRKVFLVNQLHYRNNDADHNYACVLRVFDSEAKAVKYLVEIYEKTLETYKGYGLRIKTDSYENRRKIVEQAYHEADTDEFEVEEHEIELVGVEQRRFGCHGGHVLTVKLLMHLPVAIWYFYSYASIRCLVAGNIDST